MGMLSWLLRGLHPYWAMYYLVFLASVSYLGWPIWWTWQWGYLDSKNPAFAQIVDIYGMSAGTAIIVAVVFEVGGRIVLLIPPAVKELKERGRRELLADVEANPRIPEKAKEEMRRMVQGRTPTDK